MAIAKVTFEPPLALDPERPTTWHDSGHRLKFGTALKLPVAIAMVTALLMADARADCQIVPFHVSQPIVENFMFGRISLLRDYPTGGDALTSVTSVLAMASKSALPRIIGVARTGTRAQRLAIGAGLGLAAQRCSKIAPRASREIAEAAKTFPDADFKRVFDRNFRLASDLDQELDLAIRLKGLQKPFETAKPDLTRRSGAAPLSLDPIQPVTTPPLFAPVPSVTPAP